MVYLLAVLLLLAGCTSPPAEVRVDRYPILIESTPLPAAPSWFRRNELILDLRIYVAADGSVRDLEWIESSNDKDWDADARDAILKWKYQPALEGGKPIAIWVRNTVKVQFEEPVTFPLAEIVCPNGEVADSVYALLAGGRGFADLAREVSVGSDRANGGYRGLTNIGIFPVAIREVLRKLKEGEITKPLRLGDRFVIYKRLAPEVSAG
jgi:TonB family protein